VYIVSRSHKVHLSLLLTYQDSQEKYIAYLLREFKDLELHIFIATGISSSPVAKYFCNYSDQLSVAAFKFQTLEYNMIKFNYHKSGFYLQAVGNRAFVYLETVLFVTGLVTIQIVGVEMFTDDSTESNVR
jgi:hypothetical protein